jgi:hypothetical protein
MKHSFPYMFIVFQKLGTKNPKMVPSDAAALASLSSLDGTTLEGDVASRDGAELDGVLDLAHEHREEGHGLADAGVVNAHEATAAGGVVGVAAAMPEAVPPPVGGVLPLPLVGVAVVMVVVVRLHLVGRRGAVAVQLQRLRRVGAGEGAQAAGLVGQVELRPAEHLRLGAVAAAAFCCNEDEQQEEGQGRRVQRRQW